MKQVQRLVIGFSGFDWNAGNRRKAIKHGVGISEIELLFKSEVLMIADPAHSLSEERFIAVGDSMKGRAMFIAFTFRDLDGNRLIRVISARYMHKKERGFYEELKKSI
jgi:uncharacterized DUF497 family protein